VICLHGIGEGASDSPQLKVVLACDFHFRYSVMLAAGEDRAGARVMLLTRRHDEEFGGHPGAAASFVAEHTPASVRHLSIGGRVRSPRGMSGAVGVAREIHRFGPDVVHLQESIGTDARLVLASGARPRRFALTIHDPVRHPGERRSKFGLLGNAALVRAAGLIFVHAEALREELEDVARPRAPIVVVPHGVDPQEPEPLPDRPAVLFFGRLGRYKGVDVLLDAMTEVWASLPEARLTIAGDGELEDHPALRDERVMVRRGYLPDEELPALFAAARCVVLPYRQASQSGVGSLAKRYGRPLVVSEVGGLPELVADGSGLTVAAEDPGALARALAGLLGDEERCARLGEAARRSAAAGSDWGTVGAATLAAYREHLVPPRAGG
jgi:glycosyltransferase involved in cell wall biosynthesis